METLDQTVGYVQTRKEIVLLDWLTIPRGTFLKVIQDTKDGKATLYGTIGDPDRNIRTSFHFELKDLNSEEFRQIFPEKIEAQTTTGGYVRTRLIEGDKIRLNQDISIKSTNTGKGICSVSRGFDSTKDYRFFKGTEFFVINIHEETMAYGEAVLDIVMCSEPEMVIEKIPNIWFEPVEPFEIDKNLKKD